MFSIVVQPYIASARSWATFGAPLHSTILWHSLIWRVSFPAACPESPLISAPLSRYPLGCGGLNMAWSNVVPSLLDRNRPSSSRWSHLDPTRKPWIVNAVFLIFPPVFFGISLPFVVLCHRHFNSSFATFHTLDQALGLAASAFNDGLVPDRTSLDNLLALLEARFDLTVYYWRGIWACWTTSGVVLLGVCPPSASKGTKLIFPADLHCRLDCHAAQYPPVNQPYLERGSIAIIQRYDRPQIELPTHFRRRCDVLFVLARVHCTQRYINSSSMSKLRN